MFTCRTSSSRIATRPRRANSDLPRAISSALWAFTPWPQAQVSRYEDTSSSSSSEPYCSRVTKDEPLCSSRTTATLGGGWRPGQRSHNVQGECRAIFKAKREELSLSHKWEAGYATFIVETAIVLIDLNCLIGRTWHFTADFSCSCDRLATLVRHWLGSAKKKITFALTIHALSMLHPSWHILLLGIQAIAQWIDYPDSGPASMTHYTIPLDFVAACGCTGGSTHYPTAALSQMAYGSSDDYGAHIFIISCHRHWYLFLF